MVQRKGGESKQPAMCVSGAGTRLNVILAIWYLHHPLSLTLYYGKVKNK